MEALERFRDWLGPWPTNVVKTLLILTPSILGFLILYLQQRRLNARKALQTTYANTSACSNCKTAKSADELKRCSTCKTERYCDVKCQKAHWPVHKHVCGKGKGWKEGEAVGVEQGIPEGTTRVALESNLRAWADYHRALLMFSTIQALSLPTQPTNSESLLFLISLVFKPPPTPSTPVHMLFTLEDATPLDAEKFAAVNPGMQGAFSEVGKMRAQVKAKGGEGVAILLVRCGPIVQVIPVGLPSMKELQEVKVDKQWRARLNEVVKAGVKLD